MFDPATQSEAREKLEPNYDAEMRLPEGKTCADCAHIKLCAGMGFTAAESASCDFWPTRFLAKREA